MKFEKRELVELVDEEEAGVGVVGGVVDFSGECDAGRVCAVEVEVVEDLAGEGTLGRRVRRRGRAWRR